MRLNRLMPVLPPVMTALATAYSFFVSPAYSVFRSDQLLYFPYMFRSLFPGALEQDFMAQLTPALYSFFDETIAGIVSSTGFDLYWILFLLALITRFAFFYSIYRIINYFTKNTLFSILSLSVVLYGFVIYGTGMRTMAPMLIARDMALAFSLFSLSFLLEKKVFPASLFLGVAALFNVSTVVPFAVIHYGIYLYKYLVDKIRPNFFEVISLILPAFPVVALWLLASESAGGLFNIIDSDWKDILLRRVSVIFVSTWYYPNSSPLYIAVSIFFYFLLRRELPDIFSDPDRGRFLKFIFFVPVGLALFSIVVGDFLGSAFVAQLQLGRTLMLWKLILNPLFAYYAYRYIREHPKDLLYNFSLIGIVASFIVSEKIMFVFLPLQITLWLWMRTSAGTYLKIPLSWVRVAAIAALVAAFPLLAYVARIHDTKYFLDLVPEIAITALILALGVRFVKKIPSSGMLVALMAIVLLLYSAFRAPFFSIYPSEWKNKEFMQACEWVQANTSKEAIFITEPFSEAGGSLRLLCLRNVWVTKKDGGVSMYNREFAFEWGKRMGLINAMDENKAALDGVAEEYKVGYVFADAPADLPYLRVFENERYHIYSVRR